VSGFATLIWPPTGIALAAILIGGSHLWPGIALGAFLVNLSIGASPGVAFGICVGNTLEAMVGAYLLRRIEFQPSLERLSWVAGFIGLAAFFSTSVSATIGTVSLLLDGAIPRAAYGPTWIAWWFGDMMGDLVVATFILVWSSHFKLVKEPVRLLEAAALSILVALSSLLLFSDWIYSAKTIFLQPFFIFPIFMLVVVRLGQRGFVTAMLVVSIVALSATATGHGRFWAGSLSEALLQVQVFLAVVAVSEMVLAAAVAERKRELSERSAIAMENAKLYREAQEAISVRDDFLSIASHELKTPLAALFLQIQLFNRGVQRKIRDEPDSTEISLPKRDVQSVVLIERQCRKLNSLLEELLDLTRIRLGRMLLQKESFDLCSLVGEVAERFRVESLAKGIQITDACAGTVVGFWDRMRIEQIVSNLLSNAIKYGEGKSVFVSVREHSDKALLVVRDWGMGISREMQEKIFQRFERAGNQATRISGLGLGVINRPIS
jgi:signal transduction histidine kinase